jgi:magnesium-transporting ATPase (P-type)
MVTGGSAKVVVCCVGENSTRPQDFMDTKHRTPLQIRLEKLSASLSNLGLYAAGIILFASIVNFIIRASTDDDYSFSSMINDIVMYITQTITIIIVAIPEGLPLVITLSLAYSVDRMKDDGLLIKELKVPEMCASIQEILIGKTGTLTTGDLQISHFFICDEPRENLRNNTIYNIRLHDHVLTLLEDSILYNNEARIEINDEACYEPVGNNTDVALLRFLQNAGVPVHSLIKEKAGRLIHEIPFSTIDKMSAVVIKY